MSLRRREGRGLGFPHAECRGPDQDAWRGQCVWSSSQVAAGLVRCDRLA